MTLVTGVAYKTTTYKYDVPEADDEQLFVKIAHENGDVWIDAAVGKAGTALNADAQAICTVAGIALRHRAPVHKVAHALKGVTHDRSNLLLARSQEWVALSIADAIGDAIWRELG